MTGRPEDALDSAIENGAASGDAEIEAMARTAAGLQSAFSVETPPASDIQAMFVEAVAADAARPSYRRLVGGLAVAGVVLLAVVVAGRNALPGHTLYSVRQALDSVGLADSAAREAARRLDKAASLIQTAESIPPSERAQTLAVEAIGELGVVRDLAEGIEPDDAANEVLARAARLEQRAALVIAASSPVENGEAGKDRGGDDDGNGSDEGPDGSGGEDSSGGDDGPDDDGGGEDDPSGPGSGDEGDPSGGDGSGEDDGGGEDKTDDGGGEDKTDDGGGEDKTDDGGEDDSSGPGGGDDGGGDDRSVDDDGSGGDDDGSGTDSSGPGSGDAGDASDD